MKAEQKKLDGKLRSLLISEWKWNHVTDFVVGLPGTRAGFNAIWVAVDCLTKSSHFLHYKMTTSIKALTKLYVKEIVRLHGVPA